MEKAITPQPQKRIDLNVSFIRILATLAVVLLHTCSTIVDNGEIFTFTDGQAKFLKICLNLLRCSVPLFFIISGKLLLSSKKELTYRAAFEKYIRRTLLALVIFSIPFAAMKIFMETKTISVLSILKAVCCNESFVHFWYLYALLAVYMILPLLKKAVQSVSNTTILAFLGCVFVFDFILPMISKYTGWDIAFHIATTYPVFYFVLGYYLEIMKKPADPKLAAGIAAASVVLPLVLFCGMILGGMDVKILCSYDSPVMALYSVGLYYLFQNLRFRPPTEKKKAFIWSIDRLCFGVYLVHPVFIQFTYRVLKITPCDLPVYPLATFAFFLIFTLCSFAASFVMQLIPPMKKYVL